VARREWNREGMSSAWSSQQIRAGEGKDGVRRMWRWRGDVEMAGGCAGLRRVQRRWNEEGGKLLRVASEAVAWRARGAGVAAVTRGAGSRGELAWSEQRRLSALSSCTRSREAGAVLNRLGQYCSTEPGPIRCTVLFSIIQTLLRFQNTK
jgi:hypothetical protein